MCGSVRMNSISLRTIVGLLHVKEGRSFDNAAGHGSYTSIEHCSTKGRAGQTVVSGLDGVLTRSQSSFAYYMLVAFEAGSPLRGLILLLLSPLIWTVRAMVSEAVSIHMFIFISTVGIREAELEGVGRAVLCKFYLEDLHSLAYQAFMACSRKCVVTSSPRVMVEPFLREYLKVDTVLGTELRTFKGYSTGLLKGPGVLMGDKSRLAVKEALQGHADLGLGMDLFSTPFLSFCKEAYAVTSREVEAVPRTDYIKPLIFHDGRLAVRPTPMTALFIYLWFPVGLVLSVARLFAWILLPVELSRPLGAFLGVRVRIRGAPPLPAQEEDGSSRRRRRRRGSVYVCTHRTLLDPVFLSVALRRRITAVTYSLSKVSEILSPIKTVTLSRRREDDARTLAGVLEQGDLVICPEGTTCREPYLLRFSSLFAEMSDSIVPVCMRAETSLFHGTTARGFKGMDAFYFLMNPRPTYSVTILDPLPEQETCASGKTCLQVANHLQRLMASVMGYQCTTLTRKDKYRILAGNDGLVSPAKSPRSIHKPVKSSIKTKASSGCLARQISGSMISNMWISFWKCFSSSKQGF